MANLKSLISAYLREAKLMQLATSANDQPWICNVWFAADEDFNIYWFSSTERRHSKEVEKNQQVAGAIVLPQKPDETPRGIQFQGVATLLTDQKDIDKAISVYVNRIFPREMINRLIKSNNHRFYKIKPTTFVLYDAVNFPEQSRQEWTL